MNKDSDITRDLLLRLLFEPVSRDSPPSGDINRPVRSASDADRNPEAAYRSPGVPDISGPDPSTVTDPEHLILLDYADPVFDSGDVTVVQTHFEALLKRRLRQEIEPRPPLFPWEKNLQDYPDAFGNEAGGMSLWLDHLQNLDIPSTLPDEVLVELFDRCQRLAQQTWKTGRRLVGAVETLFPDQPQTLEHIAGMVSRPAYRSSQAKTLDKVDYEAASPQQQIALSMMAAQNIFEALSISVSVAEPTMKRQWLTAAGVLEVEATYVSAEVPQLKVKTTLPQAGTLTLAGGKEEIESHRSGPGELVVHLDQPQAGQSYQLDVALGTQGACPLQFQVLVEEA